MSSVSNRSAWPSSGRHGGFFAATARSPQPAVYSRQWAAARTGGVHLLDALLRLPQVALDITEEVAVVAHHLGRLARRAVLKLDKAAIAKLLRMEPA